MPYRLTPDEQESADASAAESAADLIDDVPTPRLLNCSITSSREAASIFNELDSDEAADVLAEMDREDVEET